MSPRALAASQAVLGSVLGSGLGSVLGSVLGSGLGSVLALPTPELDQQAGLPAAESEPMGP
jgi:hypothetical protein